MTFPAGSPWAFSKAYLQSIGARLPARRQENAVGAAPSHVVDDEDKMWASDIFREWVTGRGPSARIFGPRAITTRQMMSSPDVAQHRLNFIAKGGGTYGPAVVQFGRGGKDGPFTAGSNATRQVVGFFYITIKEGVDGSVLFHLTNTTGLHSFLYHAPGVDDVKRTEFKPLSNKTQEYWWLEWGLIKR